MARYIPGQPFTPESSQNYFLGFQIKRPLTTDEYQFYYNYLFGDKITEAQKLGLAVALYADTKRVFKEYHEYFVDEILKDYVTRYFALPADSQDRRDAKAEITKFDSFIGSSKLPADAPADAIAKSRIQTSFTVLGFEARDLEKKQKLNELLAKEKDQFVSEEQQKAMEENSMIAAKAMNDHMKKNIRLYFAGLYNESLGRYFMDNKNSKVEFKLRKYLVDLVEEGMEPALALSAYQKYLKEIPNNPSLGKARAIVNEVMGNYSHPMKRELQ